LHTVKEIYGGKNLESENGVDEMKVIKMKEEKSTWGRTREGMLVPHRLLGEQQKPRSP